MSRDAKFHNFLIRPNVGEFLGSLIFSFLSSFAGQRKSSNDFSYPLLSGTAILISRLIFSHCCPGYFNPAVTIIKCAQRRIPPILAATFIFVQLIGFLFGVTLFRSLITQTEFNDSIVMYELTENKGIRRINRLQSFLLEIVLSIIHYKTFDLEENRELAISASWAFIQHISYPLYGFTSNFSLLLVTSSISTVFSPTTTPSLGLIYLNFFAMLLTVPICLFLDMITSRITVSTSTEKSEENVKDMEPV